MRGQRKNTKMASKVATPKRLSQNEQQLLKKDSTDADQVCQVRLLRPNKKPTLTLNRLKNKTKTLNRTSIDCGKLKSHRGCGTPVHVNTAE